MGASNSKHIMTTDSQFTRMVPQGPLPGPDTLQLHHPPVNNRPETGKRRRPSFRTAAGWYSRVTRLSSRPTLAKARGEPGPITTGGDHGSPLSRGRPQMILGFVWPKCPLGSFRQNASRSRVPGAAQHEVVRCRPGTVSVCGGPGSAVRRSTSVTRCTASGTRAGWSNPCIFLFFCRFGIFHPRSHDLKHTHTSSFPRRIFASGFATLLRSPRIEGWAERRETFGCSAEHPWGVHMTRHARRLRGALRPMTRRTTGGNNTTISRLRGVSVPIVSQTEIDPMKTALSLMLALATTLALAARSTISAASQGAGRHR